MKAALVIAAEFREQIARGELVDGEPRRSEMFGVARVVDVFTGA